MNRIVLLITVLCLPVIAFSQTTGDYRSHQTGLWSATSTWERWSGSAWVTPAPAPTDLDGFITILSTHVVTVGASTQADQVIVNAGGTLAISPTFTFHVINGADTDLQVNGTITNDGTILMDDGDGFDNCILDVVGTMNNSGTFSFGGPDSNLIFEAFSNYNHTNTTTPGAVPLGAATSNVTWNNDSNCNITGIAFTAASGAGPAGLTQSFYNFTWNTPSNTKSVFLDGTLTTIRGALTVQTTGSVAAAVLIFTRTANYTLDVGLDVNINAGSVSFSNSGGNATLNFHQGFFNHGTTVFLANAGAGNVTMNVTGSFFLLGTTFDFNHGSGTAVVNASGDVAFNAITPGGIIRATPINPGTATLNFIGTTQNYFNTVLAMGPINYTVSPTTTLTLSGALAGSGTFTLGSGVHATNGAIILTSNDASGAIQTTTAGNIQVTGTRTYNSGASITYGTGTVAIGNGHPTSSGVTTIINNGGVGVNLVSNTTIGGALILTNGGVNIQANTLTMNGTFTSTSGSLVTTAASSIAIGTATAFGNLAITGSTTLTNFSITGSGSVTLVTDLKVTGTLTEAGDIALNGHMLTISGPLTYTSGSFVSTSASSIVIDGTGGAGTIGVTGGALGTLTINRPSVTITCGNTFTLTNLNLWAGTFTNSGTITMSGAGAIVSRDAGFISNPIGATSSYDVTYLNTNAAAQTTGPELPTNATYLNNLTVNSVGPINLNAAVTVNGTTSFLQGIFNAGTFPMTIKGNLVSVNTSTLTGSLVTFAGTTVVQGSTPLVAGTGLVFGAVTISGSLDPGITPVTITGNFINNGVLIPGTSTITFGGSTTISGSTVSSFNNIVIASSSTLTAPANFNVKGSWTNNGTFTPGAPTNTVTFNGASTIGGSAVSPASDFSGIIIAALSTLTAPTNLVVGGVFTDNGTFTAASGTTVTFNSPVNQTINGSSATTFNNISSATPATLTFATAKKITGALTILPAAGSGSINANGNLTLVSNAAGDAYIAPITNGSITGNVIAQRYLPLGGTASKVYRYLASPVTGATVSQWKATFPITGTFNDPSVPSDFPSISTFTSTGKSMFFYNEAHTPTTTVADRYESYPLNGTSSSASPITNGVGYTAFVRFTTPITLSLTGVPRQGSVPITVTNQSGSTGGNDGWNLIGNPYAAPINWDNVTLPGGVASQIALKDNTDQIGLGAGQYIYYNHGAPGTGIPSTYHGTIASGQAFNVRASATTATITFTEAAKQAVTSPIFIRSESVSDVARVNISGNGKQDEIVVAFSASGNDKADNSDAYKLSNDFVNLYSFSSDSAKMAINGMGPINCAKTIALGVDNVQAGPYTFTFTQLDSFDDNVQITLIDAFTGKSVVLPHTQSTYQFSITASAASFGTKRFKIQFSTVGLPTSIALVKASACSGTDTAIGVDNSAAGVSYVLAINGNQVGQGINGNGGPISFPVSQDKLSIGVNHFTMTAYASGCSTGYVQKDSLTVVQVFTTSDLSATTACQTGSVSITAHGAPANGYYNWYVNQNDEHAIAGQTASMYVTDALTRNTTYYVAAVNSIGCEGARAAVTAKVVNYDNAAITRTDEMTLTSNFLHGNQWVLDGTILSDTTNTLKIKTSGTYTLNVKVGVCTTTAETILLITGLEGKVNGISGYPNPVSSEKSLYTVEIPDGQNRLPAQIPVYNTLGSAIGNMPLTANGAVKKGQFEFAPYPAGVYFIRVVSNEGVTVLKVIKK